VASWSWYYPFHYSPFASDIKVSLYKQQSFDLGSPFKPFEQLMAVFPQKTSWAVPKCLQPLINELSSPIADYFPTDFIIDTLGKKFAWLGEVLLPFIQ
jgi:5'-3' exoribonuclease 2